MRSASCYARRMRTCAIAILLGAACFGLSTSADAQQAGSAEPPTSRGTDDEARSLFEAGSVAFEEGRFENAMSYFRQAHSLSHRPALLYNIAMTADRLRHDEEALEAYRAYLEAVPDAPQRASVVARIDILEQAIASRAPAATLPASEPAPPAPRSSDPIVPITLLAGGLVVGAIGGGLLAGSALDVASIEGAARGTAWQSVMEAYGRWESLAIAGGVLVGVGAAVALAGAVWLGVGTNEDGPRSSVEVAFGLGSVAVRGAL
jgi:tetratricopeptide (TPR) repeat protein